VSKKHGHRKRRRRKRPARHSPAASLAAVAAALNSAEPRLRLRIRHGVLWSDYGVVLPPGKKEPWSARPFLPGPQPPHNDCDG
jgi:hypothetical protein